MPGVELCDPVTGGVPHPRESQGGEGFLLLMQGYKPTELCVGQGVTHHYDEGFHEAVGEAFDAPSSAHEIGLAGEAHPHAAYPSFFSAVDLEEGVGEVVEVYVDLLDALSGEELEDVLNYGLAPTGAMGLGISPVRGKSLVPLPAARTIAFMCAGCLSRENRSPPKKRARWRTSWSRRRVACDGQYPGRRWTTARRAGGAGAAPALAGGP